MMTSWEPPNSSSSSTFEEKNQEMMTNQEVHCHLLHLRKKPRNDNKPLGSSSSFALEEKTKI
jgi:hypothetical protein